MVTAPPGGAATTGATSASNPTPAATIAAASASCVAGSGPSPIEISSNWSLAFDDEFSGSSLDTNVLATNNGWTNQNNVSSYASNVTVANGDAILALASGTSGAEIATQNFGLPVGGYAEARIEFAGNGAGICNWPAWWVSGPSWPASGENDIAEGLGTLTVNYHSPSGAHNHGTVPGNWAGAFHIYGLYRGPNYCDVYWDGTLVDSYPTDDDGAPEKLMLTMGAANTLAFGIQGQMLVDYVRVWIPK
jgi:beta-glucanase (GH16 family)